MVRILRTRTIDAVYPFHSFEAEVDLNLGEEIVYVNFYVQDGEVTTVDKIIQSDWCWAYSVPVTEADLEHDSTDYYFSDEAAEQDVLTQMVAIWNSNPVFAHSPEWHVQPGKENR